MQAVCDSDIEDESIDVKDEKNKNIVENLFNYENNNIIVIVDKNGKVWCRGKDVAEILGYKKTRNAIATHVSKKYKKSLPDIDALI